MSQKLYVKATQSTWRTANKIYVKVTPFIWKSVAKMWVKTTSNIWRLFFTTGGPIPNPNDLTTIRLSGYNGTVATSPQTINTVLYGHDGSFTGDTPITISGRKMIGFTTSGGSTTKVTLENTDIFNMSNDTQTIRDLADESYLVYQLTATDVNGETLVASSQEIKIIKNNPVINSQVLSAEGLSAFSSIQYQTYSQNYWYNKPDLDRSYIRWSRNTSKSPGSTELARHYFNSPNTYLTISTGTANVLDAWSQYTLTSSDETYIQNGGYIIAEIVLENSYNRHYSTSTSAYSSTGDKPVVVNLQYLDANGNSGLDNEYGSFLDVINNVPVDSFITLRSTISGISASTTYRYRYRIWSSVTGLYWRPFLKTSTSNGDNAWETYTPAIVSNINNVAVVEDSFYIDPATFDGGLDGGVPKWHLEIEISALTPGFTRSYWNPPINYESRYLRRGMQPSISANPISGNTPLTVTFTGQITGVPTGTTYPKAYKIDFGDGNTGSWTYFSSGTGNPTYSQSYTYTTSGTFYPTIDTIPSSGNTAYVEVQSLNLPDMPTFLTATTDRSDGVNLTFGGSNDATGYDIFWNTSQSSTPSNLANPDFTNVSSPYLDTTISAGATRWYWVRARNSSGTSNWYPLTNGITGTRIQIIPGIPTGLSGYGNGTGDLQSITLNWNAATNANTYELFYNGTGTTPSDSFGGDYTGISGTSFTTPYSSFSANTTYYWWVRAVSSSGAKSSWSSRATVTTNSNYLTAPSIYYVAAGTAGGPVTAYFSGGSGPYYQIWWSAGGAGNSYDEYGYGSPITDYTGPSSAGTWYMYVRSVSSLTNTGTGPSATISQWSPAYAFTVSAPAVSPPSGLNINLSYSSGPSWVGSWSASGATSYSWSFYTADNSSGSNMTYRSGGSGTSMSYSGGTQYWGKLYVTATNSGGSISGESAWV